MNLIVHLAAMQLGRRVRTPGGIFYADTGVTISPGTEGVIRVVTHAGALVGVEWEGDEPGVARFTAFNAVEVLPS